MEVEVLPACEPNKGCAATVPVFKEDTEAPVLGQQQWEAVHERRARGQSISAMSREPDLDRETVRSCLQQASWQPYRRAEGACQLDAHREWLAGRAPEVNHSKQETFGSIRRISAEIRRVRAALRTSH